MTEMARLIRKGAVKTGLVLANGGVLTYQHAICLSRSPRARDGTYPPKNLLPEFSKGVVAPPISVKPQGGAVIEVCLSDDLLTSTTIN